MMTKLHMTISLNIVDDYRTFLNVKDLIKITVFIYFIKILQIY